MNKLAQLQADFQAYIFDNVKGAAFKNQIIDDKKVGVTKRLGIYYDAYRLRIIEALSQAYPHLKNLLGDALFDKTARTYIDLYPSTYRNMRWVGDKMSEHLRKTLPQHPIATEMATFEWALGLAFDAEDAAILTLQDLAEIPPENWADLRFKFHPSVQLLSLKWNVLLTWQALNAEETPPAAAHINEPCLVWRKDLNAHYRSVDLAEYAAIQQLIAGASFGDLCEKLQENASEEHATMQAAQYLAGWLNEGMISAVQA
jgi:Putative DNA-binding domain